jgi:SAM-dependent methyltransferase
MARPFYERYWADASDLSDFDLKWPVLSRFIPRERSVTILDFGCGKGHVLSEIRRINPHATLIGVDVSEEAVTGARERVSTARFSAIEDGGPLPLSDASVDFAFSSEVLEHVYDTENAFREVSRVLRPGGRALITVPYHGLLKNLAIVMFGFDRHFDPAGAHVRFFTKRSLSRMLAAVGLTVRTCGYYGRLWPFSHSVYVIAEKPLR